MGSGSVTSALPEHFQKPDDACDLENAALFSEADVRPLARFLFVIWSVSLKQALSFDQPSLTLDCGLKLELRSRLALLWHLCTHVCVPVARSSGLLLRNPSALAFTCGTFHTHVCMRVWPDRPVCPSATYDNCFEDSKRKEDGAAECVPSKQFCELFLPFAQFFLRFVRAC